MFSFLIAVIYLAFISLGLPDSVLGAAWPVMRLHFGAELSFAGVISIIIALGTILSSLLSERLTRKWGAGLVTAVSVAMTALALFGFSVSSSPAMLCLWAVPYGLGAGAVDAALNNYVALHYSSRHMSWLHCFWGVGASVGPYIMGLCLAAGGRWEMGYHVISLIQAGLTGLLFLSLPLWKGKAASGQRQDETEAPLLSIRGALKIPGVVYILIAFFAYCGAESTAGLWASTYLVEKRGIDAQTAARFASLFYLGITAGRLLNGFVADQLGDKRLIRIGAGVMGAGAVCMMLPAASAVPALAGILIFGLGCAPIYPSIIHATPDHFGQDRSQGIIGIQMACAYAGNILFPPLFGLIAQQVSPGAYPYYLALFILVLAGMTERLNRLLKNR